MVEKKDTKISGIIIILLLIMSFFAGWHISERVIQRKCNKFIMNEYVNNPVFSHCFGVESGSSNNYTIQDFSNISFLGGLDE